MQHIISCICDRGSVFGGILHFEYCMSHLTLKQSTITGNLDRGDCFQVLYDHHFFLSVYLSGFRGFDFDAIFIKAKRIS